jgi:cytochrome c peroxidase
MQQLPHRTSFSNQQLANNGLLPDNTLNDFGKYNTTKNNMDYMSFKVPSLRNAQVTFPYSMMVDFLDCILP